MEERVQKDIGRVTKRIRKTIEECEEGKRKEREGKRDGEIRSVGKRKDM